MVKSIKHSDRPHICPKPDVVHPSERWETMFVYSFICKFTNLRNQVEGFESAMDLEIALLEREPSPILQQILTRFVLNLRPTTRNLSSADQISSTVASLLGDYFKTNERTVFWDDVLNKNVDPFEKLEGGLFGGSWDFKLSVLRQLVDLQLTHSPAIKDRIDRGWGVVHNKHKRKEGAAAAPPPDPSDPDSKERLQVVPIGQDSTRQRYWTSDDSPRVYVSTNPWKITATFKPHCTTREDYMATIETLKAKAPTKTKAKRTKIEAAHIALIDTLEKRVEDIDRELARVVRARKKIEQRQILMAQAEIRQTRTRRQTRRPEYVYNDDISEGEGGDDYIYQEDKDDDFSFIDDSEALNGRQRRGAALQPQRRSARTAALNANGKRDSGHDARSEWRGERRSARLGAGPNTQPDDEGPQPKRARTEDSTLSAEPPSTSPSVAASASNGDEGIRQTITSGAAAVKPTEIAVEKFGRKKKSKYWFYAVEPIEPGASDLVNGNGHNAENNGSTTDSEKMEVDERSTDGIPSEKRSVSPAESE